MMTWILGKIVELLESGETTGVQKNAEEKH